MRPECVRARLGQHTTVDRLEFLDFLILVVSEHAHYRPLLQRTRKRLGKSTGENENIGGSDQPRPSARASSNTHGGRSRVSSQANIGLTSAFVPALVPSILPHNSSQCKMFVA